jgi:hypothetical protein
MNRIFRAFCINRFGIGPLHYISSCYDFGFEFSEIFIFEKQLPDSMIRGVGDSPYQQYAESATLRLNDTGSRRLSESLIRGVDDSPHHRNGESATIIGDRECRWLRVSVMRRVVDSLYRWVGESLTPRIVELGSRYLKKKISLASIFSTLNGWSMALKDQFGQKLARDVIYYQNWII